MKVNLFLILLFSLNSFWGQKILLSDSFNDRPLKITDFETYVDSTKSIQEYKSIKKWNHLDESQGVESRDHNYWLKTQFKNQSSISRWSIECYDVQMREIKYYIVNPANQQLIKSGKIGAQYPFYDREYATINLVFDLDVPIDEDVELYMCINSEEGSQFSFHVRKTTFFTSYAVHEFFVLGLFYGILLIIAIYNLLLFITIKDKSYLWYVLYVLGAILFSFEDSGIGYKFLWPNQPDLSPTIFYFIAPFTFLATYIIYADYFLDLKNTIPKYRKATLTISIASLIFIVLEYILDLDLLLFEAFTFPFVLFLIGAVLAYRNGNKSTRYFIAGNSFVVAGLLINLARTYGLIRGDVFIVYAYHFGIVIEIILFSIALGDRIKIISDQRDTAQKAVISGLQENEKLQKKVQLELEDKVAERSTQLKEKTIELSESNERLEELTKKLDDMNSKLDYDNWKLAREVKNQQVDRFYTKDLPKEDFMKMFPDEKSVQKFLSKLKWPEDFSCKNCSHHNFSKVDGYKRKCSKCGKIESPTAHTLYHGVRFPLTKALYFTYLVYRNPDIKLEELKDHLELGINTCSRFKQKLSERLDQRKNNWTELILD